MNRRDFQSDAEYYRAHRKLFEMAQKLGCTPIEAEAELEKREAREKLAALRERRRQLDNRFGIPTSPAQSTRSTITPQQAFANAERLLGEN